MKAINIGKVSKCELLRQSKPLKRSVLLTRTTEGDSGQTQWNPATGLCSHSSAGESSFAADTHQTSCPRSQRLQNPRPLLNNSASPDVLSADALQINKQRNRRFQLKRNHKKHLGQKHQSHFRHWIETLRWRFDYLSVVLFKKSLS